MAAAKRTRRKNPANKRVRFAVSQGKNKDARATAAAVSLLIWLQATGHDPVADTLEGLASKGASVKQLENWLTKREKLENSPDYDGPRPITGKAGGVDKILPSMVDLYLATRQTSKDREDLRTYATAAANLMSKNIRFKGVDPKEPLYVAATRLAEMVPIEDLTPENSGVQLVQLPAERQYFLWEIDSLAACQAEGSVMNHCLGQQEQGSRLLEKGHRYYSIRRPGKGRPSATMHIDNEGKLVQIYGYGDSALDPRLQRVAMEAFVYLAEKGVLADPVAPVLHVSTGDQDASGFERYLISLPEARALAKDPEIRKNLANLDYKNATRYRSTDDPQEFLDSLPGKKTLCPNAEDFKQVPELLEKCGYAVYWTGPGRGGKGSEMTWLVYPKLS